MNKLKSLIVGAVALISATCAFAQLPPGFEQIPCIVADGTQYLDTGYTPTSTDMGFYLDFFFDGAVSSTDVIRLMGSSKRNSGTWGGLSITGYAQFTGGQMTFGKREGYLNPGLVGHSRMQLELKKNHYTSSTGLDYTIPEDGQSSDGFCGNIYLGIVHTDEGHEGKVDQKQWLKGEIYRFKLYEGDAVIHDFVPVRTAGGLVGLYDVVGNLGLRTSATDSPYVAGESDLVFLEYVESTGTQHFHTGYTPKDDLFGFYLDFRYDDKVGTSGQAQILGSSKQNGGGWGGVCLNGYATKPGGQLRFGNNDVQDPCLVSGQRMQCQLKNRVYTSSTGANVVFNETTMNYYGAVYLGKIHYDGSPANTMKGLYYSFRIFDGDKVVRDYRPAKQGGVVGFFDQVTKTFKGSETSPGFVAGPEACDLEVVSVRKGAGNVATGFGTFVLAQGATFSCKASPYWTNETTQVKYACLGWTLKDGSGKALGTKGSLKFNEALPNNAALVLEWNYVPCELPAGYQLLKYITSTGNQAADLGVTPRKSTRVVYDFELTEASSLTRSLSGWGGGNSKDAFMWGHKDNSIPGYFSSSVGAGWICTSTGVALDTARHVFDLSDGVQLFDGNPYDTSRTVETPNPEMSSKHQNLYAAALHSGWGGDGTVGTVSAQMRSNIYACRIFAGVQEVADFVPCKRASDSVAGLYDVRTGAFKPSLVSGTAFVAGPNASVVPPRLGLFIVVE